MTYYNPFSDVLENAFTDALSRDNVTITCFTTGETYPAFFRKYEDNRSERNVQIMYISSDYENYLLPGTVFSHNGAYFIVINQETPENSIYRKCSVIQSNGILCTANRSIIGLPVYGEPIVNSNLTKSDNFAHFLDGDTDLITEQGNPLVESFTIGDCVSLYGRFWKITNKFEINHVVHFIIEVSEEPSDAVTTDSFTTVIRGIDTSVNKSTSTTDTLELAVYNHGVPMRGNIISYYSSDPTIATINKQTGEIAYLTEGSVIFTAIADNLDNISKSLTVTVKNDQDSTTGYGIYFEPTYTIYPAMDNELSVYAAHGGKVDSTVAISYRITTHSFADSLLSQITITPTTTGVTIYTDNRKLYGETFTLEAYNTEHSVNKTQNFTIDNFI